MANTPQITEIPLQIETQGHSIVTTAPVIHFQAMNQNMQSGCIKEEEKKHDLSSIIASSLQSMGEGTYVTPNLAVVGKEQGMEIGQAVVSCLQTIDTVGGGPSTEMDALGIVIEEVQIMEEVEWHQQEVTLQNQQGIIQFSLLCRICAGDSQDQVSVFGEEGESLRLAEKIFWHLPIEVRRDDKLPLTICMSCISKLNSCHELATSCLEANEKLRKIFNIPDTNTLYKEMSNFASTRIHAEETQTTPEQVEITENSSESEVPTIITNQRPTKRPPLPSHHLTRAMELLKKAKGSSSVQIKSRSQKDLNNGEISHEELGIKMEQQSEDGNYTDGTEVKSNIPSDEGLNQTEASDFLNVCLESVEYSRPHRQIKSKLPEYCDILLKSKISGTMHTIMNKDEEAEYLENRKRKKLRRKEWTCQTCGIVLSKRSSLIIHQQKKHSPQNFACSYCDKTFRHSLAMNLHEQSHTKIITDKSEPVTYNCEFCGRNFRGKKTLKEHILANHSDVKPYKCDKCDKNYGSLTSLNIHKATHSTETPFLCDLCGKSFKHMSNLRSHKRSHMEESDKNRQVCDVCGKGFRSRFHLSEHMNVHSGRRPYSCNVCGKHFHKKIQLRQHGSAHSGIQPFKCPLCGVRFNRRGNMTQHIKRHDRERKYTCRVCNEGFATLGAVLSHRKKHSKEEVENSLRQQHTGTVDDPEQVAYKCEVCGKLLAKKDSLSIHMRSHTGEKPFECGVCGKRLSNKGSLSYHMRSFHTGERPHSCQYCGEGFLSRESRLVHERIHTGEKPYICSVCGMGFRCSSNLAQHARVHSEARPHPCPHCEKRFQRKGALDVHMRTHTGERPYACDLCGRRFTQKNDMLKHRRTHSPERPSPCATCGQMFNHKRELSKHQLLHIATSQEQVQHVMEPTTQTVLITTADNLISYPEINVPVMENTQTLILHRY